MRPIHEVRLAVAGETRGVGYGYLLAIVDLDVGEHGLEPLRRPPRPNLRLIEAMNVKGVEESQEGAFDEKRVACLAIGT